MYIIVIAWLYVAALMALAVGTSSTGSILGAIITFFFYGLLPLALILYIAGAGLRKKAKLAALAQERASAQQALNATAPDQGCHTPAGTETGRVAAVREEP